MHELITAARCPGPQAHRGEFSDLCRIIHGLSVADDGDRPVFAAFAELVGLERHDGLVDGCRQSMAPTDGGDNSMGVEDEPDRLDGRQCLLGVHDPAHEC